jgi:hypothetical protein
MGRSCPASERKTRKGGLLLPHSIQKWRWNWATVAQHADENEMGNEAEVAFTSLERWQNRAVLLYLYDEDLLCLTKKYARDDMK